jgi:hypothetical protein
MAGDISISEICGPMATGRPSNMRKGISFANNFNAADQEHYEDVSMRQGTRRV